MLWNYPKHSEGCHSARGWSHPVISVSHPLFHLCTVSAWVTNLLKLFLLHNKVWRPKSSSWGEYFILLRCWKWAHSAKAGGPKDNSPSPSQLPLFPPPPHIPVQITDRAGLPHWEGYQARPELRPSCFPPKGELSARGLQEGTQGGAGSLTSSGQKEKRSRHKEGGGKTSALSPVSLLLGRHKFKSIPRIKDDMW